MLKRTPHRYSKIVLVYTQILWIISLCFINCTNDNDDLPFKDPEFSFHHAKGIIEWDSTFMQSDFTDVIDMVNTMNDTMYKQTLIDSFFNSDTDQVFPIIEENCLVHFIYQSSKDISVFVTSDLNEWELYSMEMTHLSNTNLYHYSVFLPPDARIEYKLIVDGILMIDPKNPNTTSFGDFSKNSEVVMPEYDEPSEIEEYDIPHGTMESFSFLDDILGKNRHVDIYLPPGYSDNDSKYPTVYFHDGTSFLHIAKAQNILDYLIDSQMIEPVIGIFVDALNRGYEYLYDSTFLDIFTNELVPLVDEKYHTFQSSEKRAVAGISMGGAAAIFFTYLRHDVFGNCAALSPAIRNADIISWFGESEPFEAKIYLDVGTYEPWLYYSTLDLANILSTNGFEGHFYSWNEYHSWESWRSHLDITLTYFFPKNQ